MLVGFLVWRGHAARLGIALKRRPGHADSIATPNRCHKASLRKRSALPMTETDERLMAALAIMGDSSRPNTG